MSEPKPLVDLHPLEYEHSFDAQALNALQATPGLEFVVRQLQKHIGDRILRIQYTGISLKITKDDYPELFTVLENACRNINVPEIPPLYVCDGEQINAFTTGIDHAIIVITRGCVDRLDEEELTFVIGHEVGHIKSRHVLYGTLARLYLPIAEGIADSTPIIGSIGKLGLKPVNLALMYWYRMSEFTADRAGFLACQNLDACMRVMMKFAGLPHKFYRRIGTCAFMRQAGEFESLDYDKINKAFRLLLHTGADHPWPVLRASELQCWAKSGEYDQVLARTTWDRVVKRYAGNEISCRGCNCRLIGTEKFCPSCGASFVSQRVAFKNNEGSVAPKVE